MMNSSVVPGCYAAVLTPYVKVRIECGSTPYSGNYLLTRVVHRITPSLYSQSLEARGDGRTEVPDAPVAEANQTLTTNEDTPVSGQVVATDVDGDVLGYTLAQGPTHGALMLDAAPRLIDDAARRRGWGAVPWDGAVPEGGIKTSRQPMSAAKREKSLERLWAALEAAGADPKRPALDTIEALGDELHRRGKAACNEFHTGVHLALYELDREALFRQPVRDRGEDASQAPIPLSDDTFLYARAAVVLSGRQTFDQVLSDYPSFAAEPRDMDAEDLLTLAESVMDALDGELQPPPGLPSYETGSNAEHWSPQT